MPWTIGLAVRIFTHERAHAGRRRVVDALVALAQEQRLAGVTVTRAVGEAARSGAPSGEGAPLIVEMVDRTERIEAALAQITALVPHSAVSVTETRIYLPASRLCARDAHEPIERTLPPDADAAQALQALAQPGVRLATVVDAQRMPVGVITLNHVLRQIEAELAERLLNESQPERLRERLLAQLAGKRARDLMRTPALTVADDTPLDAVARFLTGRHITRAPTVDAEGRYTGVISEHALVRLMLHPLLADQSADQHAEAQTEAEATLATSIEPTGGALLTAGMLADRAVARLAETAQWEETASAAEAGVALVVDARGLLCGVIEEQALLEYASAPATQGSGLATLRRLLARATGQRDGIATERPHDLRARTICQPARLIEAPETPLALALAHMVAAGRVDYAVVAAPDAPPVGVLWRQDALRALVGG
jgi:CBS domain-containing protein